MPEEVENGPSAWSDEDTIKIMLATDNHIGYLERDPVRGRDSFNTFEEILQLAVKHEVDFVLLAGDLFHENRPSRDCIYRVIALLREHTLGDRPVQVELLSDPDEGKATGFTFPAVNYEDPNFNVGIPVFSIHGNHDDPQGAGPEGALCALDLLSVTGLLNYMGKIDLPTTDAEAQTAGIAVKPVLLKKGDTRLGLYGIGNVKDARMHFELRSNRVRMFMPRDKQEWFNILLLHQNRVKRGPQEAVPEGMFDDSINLVVWGHEHDCRIIPEPVAGKQYYITQPGSSVATSLADGESLEKHVALLKILGTEFKLEPLPLRTVRPFVIDEVCLVEAAEEEGFDVTDQIEVSKFLKRKVNELIEKANSQWEERNAQALERGEDALPAMLPLIRLKVDTTDVAEMSNPIRFGQEFQGRIANPRDVLVFHRSKKFTSRSKAKNDIDQPELSIDDPDMPISEKLARVRVGTLVKEYLAGQEMQLLGEVGMGDAIQLFVEKDDPHAISSYVSSNLRALMKGVQANGQIEEEELDGAVQEARKKHEEEYKEKQKGGTPAKSKKGQKAAASDAESVDSMMMDLDEDDEDEFEEPVPKKATKTTGTKGKKTAPAKTSRAKGKGKKVSSDDDEDDDLDNAEEEPKASPKKTSRAAVLSQTSNAKKTTARKPAASQSGAKSKQGTLSFAPSGAGRGRTARTAATAARGRMQKVVEVDSDSDDD
ncbi:DNA repair exonuclease [Fomitiporia mediterranea MF3/22]|uniref:DNA repair exonuclease n=1 Tax=Fomitiporia mediterranea (strain MF3/22) TaxID=694068 RepID=UPI0004407683|nr:DNA repair exonuclease [Fomitiporia mediterranea MF3/22]EJD05327.1 DNA repair exonuclease [Fomitiporia mediterranea MF3/22]